MPDPSQERRRPPSAAPSSRGGSEFRPVRCFRYADRLTGLEFPAGAEFSVGRPAGETRISGRCGVPPTRVAATSAGCRDSNFRQVRSSGGRIAATRSNPRPVRTFLGQGDQGEPPKELEREWWIPPGEVNPLLAARRALGWPAPAPSALTSRAWSSTPESLTDFRARCAHLVAYPLDYRAIRLAAAQLMT